jgi:hypothetical protein
LHIEGAANIMAPILVSAPARDAVDPCAFQMKNTFLHVEPHELDFDDVARFPRRRSEPDLLNRQHCSIAPAFSAAAWLDNTARQDEELEKMCQSIIGSDNIMPVPPVWEANVVGPFPHKNVMFESNLCQESGDFTYAQGFVTPPLVASTAPMAYTANSQRDRDVASSRQETAPANSMQKQSKNRRKSRSLISQAWQAQQRQKRLEQTGHLAGWGQAGKDEGQKQCGSNVCTSCGGTIMPHFQYCMFCGRASLAR